MRYYIDTNVLIFSLSNTRDDLSSKVTDILSDCVNTIYVSSVAVKELLLLYLFRQGICKLHGARIGFYFQQTIGTVGRRLCLRRELVLFFRGLRGAPAMAHFQKFAKTEKSCTFAEKYTINETDKNS